jgi:hypothetical protein
MEPTRPRAVVQHVCSLTPCESRFINERRLAPHDETRNKGEDELPNRLGESVVTAERDLKLLREILERI